MNFELLNENENEALADGVRLVSVASRGCSGCYFHPGVELGRCEEYRCVRDTRQDQTSIIWVLAGTENPAPASKLDAADSESEPSGKAAPAPSESDPSGKAAHEPGAELDSGKNQVWLCISGFSRALESVAQVTTVGARKYSPNGWKQVEGGADRYMEAFGRHMLALGKGEIVDAGPGGTGCLHKAQMIWNLLASLELELEQWRPD